MTEERTDVSQDEHRPEAHLTDVVRERHTEAVVPQAETVFRLDDVHVHYGSFLALRGVNLEIGKNEITAFIGPSGCGKSTLLRCLNRMNDLIPGPRVEGKIEYHGQDLYGDGVDPVEVRRRIGMVFQKPNPFPKSIYDNVAFGPKVNGMQGRQHGRAGRASRCAGPPCGTRSRTSSSRARCALSGGQQQRLCIARAIAVRAGRDPDGRALLGPRPDRHRPHRRPDGRAQAGLHDRHRDPQHAAGGPGLGPHGVLHRRGRPAEPATAPACWSSSTRPIRSSPTRPTRAPRTTSPAGSARAWPCNLCVLPYRWEDA